jgi:hypothetical protein
LGQPGGAIPLNLNFDRTVHRGVTGSIVAGSNSDPARGGSGLNLFANPEQVFFGA